MPVKKNDCKVIQLDEGTPGGDTYYVIMPGKKVARPMCFRQDRNDKTMRCSNSAGYKTWHVGTGACAFHGGATPEGNSMATGRKSKMRERLAGRIDDYLGKDRAALLDLTYHVATTRAIFDEFIENYPDPEDEHYGMWFHRFQEIVGTLGSLVEKISRVDTRNTLTAAQVLYLKATVADIIMKYLPDPETRERAARELANRLGGDKPVELQPQEYSLPRNII